MNEPAKPCPFCGSIDIRDNGMNVGLSVYRAMWCAKCGASGPGVTREALEDAEKEARRLWNERAK